ncbi:MAG TPA: hypothetical protein PK109_01115 [Candidatus Paceibacterota bacterium]|nr:hypothetical protein [Candidatus Paceibacterota bacterium]
MSESGERPFVPATTGERERKPSLNEQETLALLAQKGVAGLGAMKPHTPFLYVLEEHTRLDTATPDVKASIARVEYPERFEQVYPGRFRILIKKGQIDYYAIHRDTGQPFHVGTGQPRERNKQGIIYLANTSNMFEAADHLFPKAKKP